MPLAPSDARDQTMQAPLAGVRVLELSYSRPARAAGSLLADLGADVVRVVRRDVEEAQAPDDADIGRDRGKRLVVLDPTEVRRRVADADIFIVDAGPSELAAWGLRESDLDPRSNALAYVWMPPYGPKGEWADLREDPLLLAAAGGIACQYPGTRAGIPVAPIVANVTQLHGALGAAAAMAALHGVEESGHGYGATISGLHACAAGLTAMTLQTLDQPMVRMARNNVGPHWRFYQGGDGTWFFLGGLTPDIFIRALVVIERADLLALPQVEGDFYKLIGDPAAGRVVNEALEKHFATKTAAEWLQMFADNNVPAAPLQTRDEWRHGEIAAANGGFITRSHDRLGDVEMPGMPFFLENAGDPGELPPSDVPEPGDEPLWTQPRIDRPEPSGPYRLPLDGVRVLDAASFLAGPLVSSFLAEHGAAVTRLEPPTGDTYRAYPTAFLSVNKLKRGLAVDVRRPEGASALLDVLRTSDVLVENLRPARMERIGLGRSALHEANPQLIHVSVSAYGAAEEYADAPGFDPVFQSLSGLAGAQGGDGYPFDSGVPLADTAAGALGAVGILAALRRRRTGGVGSYIRTSLADSVTFLQFAEFTTYEGSEPPAVGRADYPGPDPWHRLYECADGWIAVHAVPIKRQNMLDALGVASVDEVPASVLSRDVVSVIADLRSVGVDVVRSLLLSTNFTDPFPEANDWMHVVTDPQFGRSKIMRAYSDWSTTEGRREPLPFRIGEESVAVLEEAGVSSERIAALVADGTVVAPDQGAAEEASGQGV